MNAVEKRCKLSYVNPETNISKRNEIETALKNFKHVVKTKVGKNKVAIESLIEKLTDELDEPQIPFEVFFIWRAFWRLYDREKAIGIGEIRDYCEIYGIAEHPKLFDLIHQMEGVASHTFFELESKKK